MWLAQLIVQRAVLHRNKVRTLRLQRILLTLPVPNSMVADVVVVVLQTAILGPRAHIVRLVRLTTRHRDGLLEPPKRIGCIEVHPRSICIALLPTTPLRLSLLLLLQKSHSNRTARLIRSPRWRTTVAEAATCEVALLRAGDQVGPRAELLLRHTEAARTARPQ